MLCIDQAEFKSLAVAVRVELLAAYNQQNPSPPSSAEVVAPSPKTSTKLAKTTISRMAARLGMELLGAGGLLAGADAPVEGGPLHLALTAPSFSIAGGTDEIQHNVLGERALGLPREP